MVLAMNKKRLLSLAGLVLFFFIISRIDVQKVIAAFRQINIKAFVFSIGIYAIYLLIRVIKWKQLMEEEGIKYSFYDSTLMYLVGNYIGLITPGRIGDFSKIFYLRKDGHPTKKAFITVFLDRATDLLFLFLLGYAALFIFYQYFAGQIYWISAVLVLLLLIALVLMIKKDMTKRLIKAFFRLFRPEFSFTEFFKDLQSLNIKVILKAVLFTIASWLVLYISYFLGAVALGIDIPFIYLIASMSVSSLFTMLPISISGIGTRDAILILLFGFIGINKEAAVAFSAYVLLIIVITALTGLLCWLKKPVDISR
jgi:hypothetical protein